MTTRDVGGATSPRETSRHTSHTDTVTSPSYPRVECFLLEYHLETLFPPSLYPPSFQLVSHDQTFPYLWVSIFQTFPCLWVSIFQTSPCLWVSACIFQLCVCPCVLRFSYWSSVIITITVDTTVDTTSLVQFSLVIHFLLLIQLSLHLQAHYVQPSFTDHTVGVSVP